MSLALLLAALPVLYWEQPADTAAALRSAGIERLRVPAERAAEWAAPASTRRRSRPTRARRASR